MSVSIRPIARVFRSCRIIGALLALLLLSGCSAIQLAYNKAPELTYWWLDSYLDLDEPQSQRLRAQLHSLHDWHRAQALPTYLHSLAKLQRLATTQITPEQVCELQAEVQTHVQTLLDQAEPSASALALALSERQLEHLARQLDKRRQQWREEWLEPSPSERHERRVKQLTRRIELFYGSLDEPQRTLLRASAAVSLFDAALGLRESQRRHRDVLHTLRQVRRDGADAARVQVELRAFVQRTLVSPDPVYRRYQEQMRRETCHSLAELHNASTPAQRSKLVAKLKEYEGELRALMANGAKPAP